ncbi:MAG TPA: glycosyltransferase family 2 protein [Blastocatellia bacterium]|nr:glycosyltransferase family 2 protein [Blastocatellia bacterium]
MNKSSTYSRIDTTTVASLVSCILMEGDRLAIVVVSFNTRELLLECVSSATRYAPGAVIIVVDNASSDGSAGAISRKFPDVRVIENEENVGFGAACNQAIRSFSSDFYLLLNSDALLTEGTVSALLECMAANRRAGAAGCLVLDSTGSVSRTTMLFLTPVNQALELLGLRISGLTRTHLIKYLTPSCDCSPDWIEASCLMIRRSAINEIGLFDEQFFMYSEDEDLCWRLKGAGWLVCFTTRATVTHMGGASSGADRSANLIQFYASQIKLLRKHRGPCSARLFVALTRLALWLKLFKSRLTVTAGQSTELRMRSAALKAAGELLADGPSSGLK